MADLRYHIAIGRTRRRSPLAWALRKPKPRRLDLAPCGQCGGTVTGFMPNIDEAEEFFDGYARYRGADRVRDISLFPCHHLVDHLVYAFEGNEHALVDHVLQYERENRS